MVLGLRLFLFCVCRYKGSWEKSRTGLLLQYSCEADFKAFRFPGGNITFFQLIFGGYSLEDVSKIKLKLKMLPRSHWSLIFTRFIANNLNYNQKVNATEFHLWVCLYLHCAVIFVCSLYAPYLCIKKYLQLCGKWTSAHW